MKKAVHFGAGNIGRGFIGQILFENHFEITFVDVNDRIIDALNERGSYEIEIAEEGQPRMLISGVRGINNNLYPEEVVSAIAEAELVTTAIGPHILPFIAALVAKGIEARQAAGNTQPLDILACENMIGGSHFLSEEVKKHLSEGGIAFAEEYIGFPNAAVDRIVPAQCHEDPLFVVVEPFNEWVVETPAMKNPELKLANVHYEVDLEPFIERKLFSVNAGHATCAYIGAHVGAQTILEALENPKVKATVEGVLAEIRNLLIVKWGFGEAALEDYHKMIISRFENPFIVDDVARVARTPIRKLGYDERFIRPIREMRERGLRYDALLQIVHYIFKYNDETDTQSVELQSMLAQEPLVNVVEKITGVTDKAFVAELVAVIEAKEERSY